MADKVVLYSYFRSSASWRVRIALAIKGIQYEYRAVNLIKEGGEQHSEEYRKLNPMGQVPALVIDGRCLTQSLPIIEYLDEKYPEPPLLPKDPFERSQVRALSEIINSGIQPLHNLHTLLLVGDRKEAWARSHIEYGLKGSLNFYSSGPLRNFLKTTAGKYSFKDHVTIADLCLVPQVFAARRFHVDLTPFPTVTRVNAALVALEAFKAGDAFCQPDTPEDLRAT